MNEVRHCTATELLQSLDRWSVDLIFTDPPYGKGYKSNEKRSNGKKQRRASAAFGKDVFQDDWLVDAFRVLKPEGAMYLCTQWDVMPLWIPALKKAGFNVVQCIVWDKLNWGMGDLDYYGCQTEFILFCLKPASKHKLRWSKRRGNVWTMTKLDTINHEGNYDNPTQKPERLIRRAIELSSDVGDLVVDPFMGSGSTGAAARAIGRRYLMCDRDEVQYQIARDRLDKPYAVSMFAAVG